ncbi:MAG: hypothetical protein WC917_02540, partial [Bacilli bacterium]
MEKNKVLGYAEHIGIYELIDNPLSKKRDGQQKFELKRGEGENYMRFSLASRQLRWLQGEVLTVIDAS